MYIDEINIQNCFVILSLKFVINNNIKFKVYLDSLSFTIVNIGL